MKKERKLKLIVNKVKISQLNTMYGGTGGNTTVGSVVLCDTDDQTVDLGCQATNFETCDDPTSGTGATKTIITVRHCIVQSDGC